MDFKLIFSYIFVSIIAYFIGNIATSYIVSKNVAKIDIRKHGSGNAGATNVLRVIGIKAAAITFAGDALKGAVAVMIGRYLVGDYGAVLAGLFVVIGHNWPVLLKFKGGKGVAATIGAMLAINPLIVLIVVVFGAIIMITTKYVSLASITGMIIFPILMIVFKQPMEYIVYSFLMAIIATYRHRTNIVRLFNGTELKLGQRSVSE